jgi:hypothetical protein
VYRPGRLQKVPGIPGSVDITFGAGGTAVNVLPDGGGKRAVGRADDRYRVVKRTVSYFRTVAGSFPEYFFRLFDETFPVCNGVKIFTAALGAAHSFEKNVRSDGEGAVFFACNFHRDSLVPAYDFFITEAVTVYHFCQRDEFLPRAPARTVAEEIHGGNSCCAFKRFWFH